MVLISKILPDSIDKALQDQSWIDTIQEQLNQFEKSKVWTPVSLPKRQSIIRTRWVFRNKLDETRQG